MRLSFLNKPYPVISGIMAGQTPGELIAEAKGAEADGAHGITVELFDFKPEFRNADSLKGVINSVALPFMFCFYRNDRWGTKSDEERQTLLLAAADAGASMIDVMGDLYDPSPREITYKAKAIAKQKRLIDRIHKKGADVVMSSHTQCVRTADETAEHLLSLESRGADVVKLVSTVDTEEELAEALRTTMLLRHELKVPFIHLCGGKFSRPHRFLCPVLGTSILFAVHRYDPRYGFVQPTIRAMKSVLDNIRWDINSLSPRQKG